MIDVAKWLGTLAPTIVFGALAASAFILGVGILCSVFDLVYVGLLLWARRGLARMPADEAPTGASSITSVKTTAGREAAL